MSRTSRDELDADGSIRNGFDYALQVWVKDGICQPVGSGASQYAGLAVATVYGHEVRKPGTRCECDGSCQNKPHTFECAEAVRMVKVERVTMRNGIMRESMLGPKWTWLCAPCAAYHEARQKAGA